MLAADSEPDWHNKSEQLNENNDTVTLSDVCSLPPGDFMEELFKHPVCFI